MAAGWTRAVVAKELKTVGPSDQGFPWGGEEGCAGHASFF